MGTCFGKETHGEVQQLGARKGEVSKAESQSNAKDRLDASRLACFTSQWKRDVLPKVVGSEAEAASIRLWWQKSLQSLPCFGSGYMHIERRNRMGQVVHKFVVVFGPVKVTEVYSVSYTSLFTPKDDTSLCKVLGACILLHTRSFGSVGWRFADPS